MSYSEFEDDQWEPRDNEERIKKSGSSGFYGNIPLNKSKDKTKIFYDVGSTLYEDVKNQGLIIKNFKKINEYFKHYEGSSWRLNSKIDFFIKMGLETNKRYEEEIEKYKNTVIMDKFEY